MLEAGRVGDGKLDSLAWGVWAVRGRGAARRGDPAVGFGGAVLGLGGSEGLLGSADGAPCVLEE